MSPKGVIVGSGRAAQVRAYRMIRLRTNSNVLTIMIAPKKIGDTTPRGMMSPVKGGSVYLCLYAQAQATIKGIK